MIYQNSKESLIIRGEGGRGTKKKPRGFVVNLEGNKTHKEKMGNGFCRGVRFSEVISTENLIRIETEY